MRKIDEGCGSDLEKLFCLYEHQEEQEMINKVLTWGFFLNCMHKDFGQDSNLLKVSSQKALDLVSDKHLAKHHPLKNEKRLTWVCFR